MFPAMTTSLLATLIFLLPSGLPARNAFVSCQGVATFEAGNEAGRTMAEGSPLILDARGATVLVAPEPSTITCRAYLGNFHWSGAIALTHRLVQRIWLRSY